MTHADEPDGRRGDVGERRFRDLFERAGFGIAITDLEGRFIDANAVYAAIVGYSVDELRERDFLSVTHPDDRHLNTAGLASLLRGEVDAFDLEKRYVTRDGSVAWIRGKVSLIRGEDDAPVNVVGTFEDITAAKLTEQQLARSEELRRVASELALVGGWAIEADGTFFCADEVYTILGLGRGEPPTLDTVRGMFPPAQWDRVDRAVARALDRAEPFDLDLELHTRAGRDIPIRVIGRPQLDAGDRVARVVGAVQDVSDLRRLTGEVQRTAERLRRTFESMSDAVYTLDRDLRFTYLNPQAGRLLRRDPSELMGKEIWAEFPDAAGTPLRDLYARALRDGTTEEIDELHYPTLDAWFWVVAYPSEHGLAVYFRDVTGEREARVALQANEVALSRQAALLDEATDAIIVRGLDRTITYWNRSAEQLYGWSADEAIGSDIRALLHDDVARFDEADAALLAAGSWAGEFVLRSRAGKRRIVAVRWTLIRDADGQPDTVLAINSDVTEQRNTELQLIRAQRLESIGTLAGGVAHDLNNTLSPILLATEMLQVGEGDADRVELLAMILDSARRAADLVAQLLSFARGVDGERVRVDVGELLHELHRIVRETFPKNVVVRLDPRTGIEPVVGDRTQLHQVLLNLAVNARDAMPDGGTITISASTVDLDVQYLVGTDGAGPGRYVLIEVEDDGHGMTPDLLDRVFEPFFTTKEPGSGTGLGLSMTAGIVQSHGGFVRAYSEVGSGSRFRVYLPASGQPDTGLDSPAPSLAAPLRGAGETVLVVDDEDAIRATTRRTLEGAGYLVLEAANGAEAVAAFARHQEQIDVVLIDMMMPVMDGASAIRALRSLDADARIIAASGLHGNGKTTRAANAGVRHFLPKPYTSGGLLQAVAESLAD